MKKNLHHQIYYWLLTIYAASIVWSVFMMFLMPALLLTHWLLSGNWQSKWQKLKTRKSIWFTLGIFLLYLIGMLYSNDVTNAWKLVRFILPMAIGALVAGTNEGLSNKQIKILFYIFITSISGTAIFNLLRYSFFLPEGADIRQMSRFMSHIRYALFINMAIFGCIYYLVRQKVSKGEILLLITNLLWLSTFLFLLQSFTGLVLFFTIGTAAIVQRIFNKIQWKYIIALLVLLLMPLLYVTYIIKSEYSAYYEKRPLPKVLPQFTALGNAYSHDTANFVTENGNRFACFVCEPELIQAWNNRCSTKYDEFDYRKQYLCNTIKRYLTSLELPKDAYGVSKLTDKDIKNILSGYTNYKYTDELSFRSRIRSTLWQIDAYKKVGYADGSSIIQRLIFYQCAFMVISDNVWFGVGTGDGINTMKDYYPKVGYILDTQHWLDSHNQYLNALVAFGVVGSAILALLLVSTIYYEKCWKRYLFAVFLVILVFSMFVEDTMNTFAGATFFSLFWTILVFALPSRRTTQQENTIE